ncbi:cytochrome c oxidase assembly protein [Nakamurella lactea]|uniref:cytochrome c oxidase assembly protein n=1 Tax=Nakamurella lactea TaxID=459515 RepID=UPI0013776A32|nr:cytochrome c oxidase assembly protein [Nakamurella lactea]
MTESAGHEVDAGGARGFAAPSRWSTGPLALAAAAIVVCVAVGITAAVQPRDAFLGLPDPGVLTSYGLPAVKGIFDLSTALTFGWLLAAALYAPPQRSGIFTVSGYRAVRAASLSATVWAVSGLALVPLNVSEASGATLAHSLGGGSILSGLQALESIRAPLIAAVGALLIAIISRSVLRPGGAFLLLALAVAAVVPMAIAGHAAQSGDHDLASNTMIYHLVGVSVWIGGLVALIGLARQRADHLGVIAQRYSNTALVAFIAVTLSGVGNAWLRFSRWSDVFSTEYGTLVIAKTVLLVVLGVIGFLHRRVTLPAVAAGKRRPLTRLAVVETLLMATTMGIAVALGRTASPPPSGVVPDPLVDVLGYSLPGPPTIGHLLFAWRFDLIFGTAALVAIGLYIAGLVRLRRQQIAWPRGRTISWIVGWLLILFATSSGFGAYATAQFSIHMMTHMVLGMMAPILLVLGGPVTLAMRALPAAHKPQPPGMRELVVRIVHSPLAKAATHPLVVFPLFIGSFYAIYFTPLFDTLMSNHIGHVIMGFHFLLVGYLYYWVIIGVDPAPRRLPPMLKLGLLLGALPFHAFFGLTLMNSHSAMAADYYRSLSLPWVTDLVSDQRLGGAIAWGATELPIIIVVIALMAQWSSSDAREAKRLDRPGNVKAERELDDYNAMLAELAFRDLAQDQAAGKRLPATGEPPAGGS